MSSFIEIKTGYGPVLAAIYKDRSEGKVNVTFLQNNNTFNGLLLYGGRYIYATGTAEYDIKLDLWDEPKIMLVDIITEKPCRCYNTLKPAIWDNWLKWFEANKKEVLNGEVTT